MADAHGMTKWSAIAIVAVCITVVVVLLLKRDVVFGPDGVEVLGAGKQPDIAIQVASSKSPDFVILKNNTTHQIDLTNWIVCESENRFLLPSGTTVAPGNAVTIQFFSRKKPENQKLAEEARAKGGIACDTFGLSSGETVRLLNRVGDLVDSKAVD